MVNTYGDFLKNSNSNNRFKPDTDDDDKELKKVNLDIWDKNPAYNDINSTESILKATSLVVIGLLYFISILYATYNLVLSIVIAGIVTISFIVAFHKQFFSLRHVLDFRSFDPFRDFVFWRLKDQKSVLFFTNHIMRLFRIKYPL